MPIPFHTFETDPGEYREDWFEFNHWMLSFDAEMIIRESVSINSDFRAPQTQGIYFLVWEDRVVYVGISGNIDRRLEQHRYTKDFKRYWCFGGVHPEWLSELEGYYIAKLNPYFNTLRPGFSDSLRKTAKRYRALWKAYPVTFDTNVGVGTMKTNKLVAIAATFAFSAAAHAGTIGGPHGGMSSGAASPGMMGMQAGPGSHGPAATGTGSAAEGQSGQGGYYYGPRDGSVVDNYQPWPEAEMRQYQLP